MSKNSSCILLSKLKASTNFGAYIYIKIMTCELRDLLVYTALYTHLELSTRNLGLQHQVFVYKKKKTTERMNNKVINEHEILKTARPAITFITRLIYARG